jgi:type II secretory pathway pseudopilin PulG
MRKRQKKSPLTLLEIMIVIFLIGLIGSVIGYNVKGSLDEGKAFRSEQGAAQIHDILLLEVAKGHDIEQVIANKEAYLESSGLVKDVKKLLKDGWGELYEVYPNRYHTDILIKSKKLAAYKQKKNAKLGPSAVQEEEEQEEDAI